MSSDIMKNTYIGDKLIQKVSPVPDLPRVVVTFEDGTEKEYTQLLYDVSRSDKPVDASALQHNTCIQLALRIMQTLLDWDMTLTDSMYANRLVITSLEQWKKEADEKLWKAPEGKMLISTLDRVLKGKGVDA